MGGLLWRGLAWHLGKISRSQFLLLVELVNYICTQLA